MNRPNRLTVTLTDNGFKAMSTLSELCNLSPASLVSRLASHFVEDALDFNEAFQKADASTRSRAINAIEAHPVIGLSFFKDR